MDKEYAVVQGPLSTTRVDFWRMVWEHNAQAIVMLTKCEENGQAKCDHYWPANTEPMYYGYLKVQVISQTTSDDWIVSRLMLSKGRQGRTITHFHYTAWHEMEVPRNTQSIIAFVRLVRNSLESRGGPLVVHCSTGCGRSGTFVALDRLLQHIGKHDWCDVFGTVCDMRTHRCHMIWNQVSIAFQKQKIHMHT
ncbi:hypothetical protein NP493_1546g00012 [Ridgeia piscesae]|uniref:Protein tyrosine phosphatase n=1 Tax=Ridgeia piscesae TaxID=27915 RepID=A0AAD9NCE0_RIDPI|nr:hypothetical protein NP493_1546g00012 [Ridgeia piscesae]